MRLYSLMCFFGWLMILDNGDVISLLFFIFIYCLFIFFESILIVNVFICDVKIWFLVIGVLFFWI